MQAGDRAGALPGPQDGDGAGHSLSTVRDVPRLERVRAGDDQLFRPVWAIYERAFSPQARRDESEVRARLSLESFRLEAVIADGGVAGFIESWDIHGTGFIEHIAIREDLRGRGLGTKSLDLHLSGRSRAALEVDRGSADAERVLRFYTRLGFERCDLLYVQPPYSPEKSSLPMWLMTYPRALGREDAESLTRGIYSTVYRIGDPSVPLEFQRWLGDWESGDTPWAGEDADRALYKHYGTIAARFGVPAGARAFVPLCGDSPSVEFLHGHGHSVTALDYVPAAIYSLAERLGSSVTARHGAGSIVYSGDRLELVLADIFDYESRPFDLIYDRAALIAIAPPRREEYAQKLDRLLGENGIIIVDARELTPPDASEAPYPITREEISALFPRFELFPLATSKVIDVPTGMYERGIREITKTFSVLKRC